MHTMPSAHDLIARRDDPESARLLTILLDRVGPIIDDGGVVYFAVGDEIRSFDLGKVRSAWGVFAQEDDLRAVAV